MKNGRKVTAKTIAAAAACAMLAAGVPLPAPVQAAEDSASNPQPVFCFDMESIADGKVTNQADGSTYEVGGNSVEQIASIGENGQALRFDGTNYIDLGTDFQPQNAYTMTAWVKQDSGSADGQAIFARAWSGNVSDQLAMMVKNGTVYHSFSVDSGGANNDFHEFSTQSALETDKWEHVAVTRDGQSVTVYVNGESIYASDDFPASDFAVSDKHMYIGMDCNSSGALYSQHAFKGALDELRLYDTALTQEQIQELAYVEPGFEIAEASNGSVIVSVKGDEAPAQEDFDLAFEIDGETTDVNITGYQFEASEKKAIFSFDPLVNMQNVDKTVTVKVGYQGVESEMSFVLPAGDNESPAAVNLSVTNMSEKLGSEPHVKGMLKAEYTFEDPDNDAEGDTKYQWYIADAVDGEYTKLSGICTKTVILLDDYVGKYLKCEVTPADVNGNKGESVMTPATTEPVQATEGNPLTDWFHEAGFGLSHHFLSNYFNLSHVYTSPEEMWDRDKMTWDEFVGQFDAEAYAKQVNAIGAKFVIITLGQNSGSYCAPNDVYDKYMREAGFIQEGEKNPKTTSYENDLPMKMADALAKYGIKVMLYLPSNPPHSASWDESGTPNGYGYYSDYLVTKEVFDYTPGTDGVPSQKARKVLAEMVEWWSLHYGDKIAGWWFDGFYHTGEGSQLDMSLEYNVSTLANAAKAGNPYSIVTFNKGMGDARYQKVTEYTDYTAGECTGLDGYPNDGRWTEGTTDCQNFMFGPLGSRDNWSNGWGCSGINHQDVNEVIDFVDGALERDHVIGLDVKVNVFGQIDPAQYKQLEAVQAALWPDDEDASSKTTLEYFLNKAKEYLANGDVDDCVESIQKLFEEAIAEGDAVMADENATSEEIKNASWKLVKAINALDMKAADKMDLEMAVELAEMIDLTDYVEAGQAEFTGALASAKKVLADSDAMQGETDAAWDTLVTAMEKLRLKADKSALEELLNEVGDLDLSKYTEESAEIFRTALASAQAVFADDTLSEDDQQTVDDAVAALGDARDGLVLKDDGTGTGNGDEQKPDEGNQGNDNNTGNNNSGTGGNTDSADSMNKAAKTGDEAPVAAMLMLVLVSGAAAVTVLLRKRVK